MPTGSTVDPALMPVLLLLLLDGLKESSLNADNFSTVSATVDLYDIACTNSLVSVRDVISQAVFPGLTGICQKKTFL